MPSIARVPLLIAALTVTGGCIRSPSDASPPGEGGSIDGTVLIQDAVTGRLRAAEDVLVSIDELTLATTSNSEGRFRLTSIPLGRWRVRLTQNTDPLGIRRERWIDPTEITADQQDVSLGNVELRNSGGLTGTVRTRSEDGTLAAPDGTLVVLARTPFKAVAGQDGIFLLPEVPQGAFELVAFRTGFRPGRVGVEVQPGTILLVTDLTLVPGDSPTNTVRGQVLLPDGTAAAGVSVRFVSEQDAELELSATSDELGNYALDAVPVGPFVVEFVRDGFVPVLLDGVVVLPEATIGLRPVRLRSIDSDDQDGDGLPDAEDEDDDNDGCPDAVDAFPNDRRLCRDTDGDGIDDKNDPDDDGDTLSDAEELSPGADGFITDPRRQDTDQDGFLDPDDLCPLVPSPTNDASLCEFGPAPIGPPVITEIRPLTGRAGDNIEVLGDNFVAGPFTQVRFGASGEIVDVPAQNVAEQRIVVTVPRGAASGPLFVSNAGRTVTSSQSFTFQPPPEIFSYVPAAGRVNDGVVVFGRGLSTIRAAAIGTIQANLQPCGGGVMPPEGQEAACFTVPAAASTGPITVTTETGNATSNTAFVVLSGPQIRNFVPIVASPQTELRIIGEGFAGPTSVTVRFGGNVTAVSSRLSDREIVVTVPAGAETGLVTVVHPAGDAVSSDPLVVDNRVPVVQEVMPYVVVVDDTLDIFGRNLGDATEVEFPGGTRVPPQIVNGGLIRATVPADVVPGPLTVHFSSSVTAPAPDDLAVLTVLRDEQNPGFVAGSLVDVTQNRLGLLSQTGAMTFFDLDTLQIVREQNITPGPVEPGPTITAMWASPTVDYVVINENNTNLISVDGPTLTTIARCEDIVPWSTSDMVFLGDHAFFRANLGLYDFDLRNGTCTEIMPEGDTVIAEGLLYAGQGLLHVYERTIGQSVLDIDRTRPTFGTFIQRGAGPVPPFSFGLFAWFGANSNELFFWNASSGGREMRRAERLSTASEAVQLFAGGSATRPLVDSNGRWVVISNGFNGFIFDSLTSRIAREEAFGDTDRGTSVPSATGSAFVLSRIQGFRGMIRLDIQDRAP